MGETAIEWTDKVWNPVRGCKLVSPGCTNCYAMRQAHRFAGPGGKYEGLTKLGARGPIWTGEARPEPDMLDAPLRWRKPCRIFVNSMSDLFHEDVPDDFIAAVFGVMAMTPRHTYQVLTKRADRLPKWFEWLEAEYDGPCDQNAVLQTSLGQYHQGDDDEAFYEAFEDMLDADWPLPNVWLGVSVEDRARVRRMEPLRFTPAAVRFLSVEPLLEDLGPLDLTGIHWVIVGGESGPGARPMHPDWARSIRDQCRAAGVPFFFKQWGEWAPLDVPFRYRPAFGSGNREYCRALARYARERGASVLLDDRPEGWDATMIRDGCAILDGRPAIGRVGKKAAGRTLDGRTWDEFPEEVPCVSP